MKAYLLLAVALSGCAPFVHSPPGRMLALETAQTLEKGQTGIRAGGGGGISVDNAFAGGFVRVRHGIGRGLDFRADVSAFALNPDSEIIGTDALVMAGAGIKYAFNPYFAVAFDLTGGWWNGGGFMSPELNFIAAYENKYFIPFIDAGYYTSHPISPNDVRIDDEPLLSDGVSEIVLVGPPVFTQGWIAAAGFRIPTSDLEIRRAGSAIILGTRFTGAYFNDRFEPEVNQRDSQVYWAGSAAFEVVFE